MRKQLKSLFQPKSIAVIGASDDKTSVGYAVMKNLLDGDFKGRITPVNLKHKLIHGLKSYYYIKDLPEPPDLAIITTPAYAVLQVVRECGEAKVGGLAILSAGFSELDEEGKHRLERIQQIAREYNIRVLGPNCLGFINPHLGINASFSTRMASAGNIAFISQSGALGIATLDWAIEQNVGFSYFISVGNMADIGFADMIDFLGTDAHTSCILIYMESLKETRRFMSAARAFARYKPIIVLKAGRSLEGQRVAASHTGLLIGNDVVFSAAFQRSGIIRVAKMAQLFNCAQSLAMQPRPNGNRLAILTNAVGPGVLSTDYLIANKGKLALLSEKTYDQLNEALPVRWSHRNPVNILGDADSELYGAALKILLKDPNVDGILVIMTHLSLTNPVEVAKEMVKINKHAPKPILAAWMGESSVQEAREVLEAGKVPNYRYPESAVEVFLFTYQYNRNLELLHITPPEEPQQFKPKREKAEELIRRVQMEGRQQLLESEAKELLSYYELPVPEYCLATTPDEAIAFAEKCGYPVALKVATPEIYHKSDIGGVALDLNSATAVKRAYRKVVNNLKQALPDAEETGVIIEPMMNHQFELLLGAKKDPVMGPVIAFGKGGINVGIYKDTRLGLPPMNMALARRMIEKTKIFPLLKGYRNQSGVDLEELAFIICKFSYLVMDFPQIKELEINPLAMGEDGTAVLDALVVLESLDTEINLRPHSHLIIPPYPGRYKKWVTTKNGERVFLRPIRPEDEPLELEMVNKASRESLYYRFFGYVPKITHEFLIRFTQIDYDREMAIVAVVNNANGEEEMIGVVRIVGDPWGEAAEYAILVADEWQGQGLGSQMTDYILEIGKDMGLKQIYASVLSSNKGMINLFKRKGFTIEREDFETYKVELELT